MGSSKALQMTRTGFRRSASGLAPLWDMFRWLLGQIYIYIYTHTYIYLFVFLSVYLFISLSLSVYLSVSICVCLLLFHV